MKRFLSILLTLPLLLLGCADTSVKESEITRIVAPDDPNETEPPMTEAVAEPSRLAELIESMTLEEKIGQLMLVRIDSSQAAAIENIEKYHLGGYVLFASDFKERTADEATEYIGSLQAASDIPLLIAVDEEGGTVVRVSKYSQYRSEPFKSPRELLKSGSVKADTAERCELLSSLGINLNLAPVADISTDKSEFIYYRSAGDLKATIEYVKTFVESSKGIGTTLKHFPGYGGNADTHTGTATDTRDYQSFVERDFLPFIAGIEVGADAIMISHNTVLCMDTEYPASLSKNVHAILRNELGFDGVILTDDLSMDAVADIYTDGEAGVLAFEAGNDIICCSELEENYSAILEAVRSGRISEERLDESVERILALKAGLGLIEQ